MRSTRGKRIFKETSEAPVWYLQLWQSLSVDFTNEGGIISRIDKSGFLRLLGTTIMPAIASFLIIAPIMNTWQTIKNYYHANNKNLDKTLDLMVNILMTLTSVGVMVTLMAGVVYVSPYILLVAMSVSLGYGVYNVVKHIWGSVAALEEGDFDRHRQHLMAIPYHIILSVLSGLGLLVQLNYAFNIVVFNGIFKIVQISNVPYNVAQVLLYVFGSMLTLGSMPALARMIMEYNQKTWTVLSDPFTYLNDMIFGKEAVADQAKQVGLWPRFKAYCEYANAQPLQALLYAVPNLLQVAVEGAIFLGILAGRAIAIALLPLQLIGFGVSKAYSFINDMINPAPQIASLSVNPIAKEEVDLMSNNIVLQHKKLKKAIDAKIIHLDNQERTPKIIAKSVFLTELKCKLGDDAISYNEDTSIDQIEANAKIHSSHLYQSFWRPEGGVEKIARQFEEFDDERKKVTALRGG